MKIRSFYIITLIALMTFLMTGCAHIPMDKKEEQSIKTVYINPTMNKPKDTYEFRNGYQFGLIGAAARTAIDSANGQNVSMKTIAEKNHIDISQIVYQAWKKELSNGMYKTSDKPADATLTTEIKQYGISIPHGLSNSYVPVLVLESKLVKNNKVIWQDRESVYPFTKGMPSFQMDEILIEPKYLEIMWSKAADKAVSNMIADMRK